MYEASTLKTILNTHQEAIHNARMLKGLLMDYFSKNTLLVHLLTAAYEVGLVFEVEGNTFNEFSYSKYLHILTAEYGFSQDNAERAIAIWLEALDVKIRRPASSSGLKTRQDPFTQNNLRETSQNRVLENTTAISKEKSKESFAPPTGMVADNSAHKDSDASFADNAVISAHIYHDYLTEKGGGVVSSKVKHKIRNEFGNTVIYNLFLESALFSLDSVQIRIDGKDYSTNDIKPVEYDKITKMLKVQPAPIFRNFLDSIQVSQIIVVSDLKFLVKKVENWYKQYGARVCLPVKSPSVHLANCSNLSVRPFPDQEDAIKESLSNSFTYVWGAPGTGKTRLVLSRCVLAYIQAGKRVLVTAPTNNAVEQTLNGLLPELTQAGYDLKGLVVRIGVPSTEFAEKYPSVCENAAYAKMIADLSDSITALKNRLSKSEDLLSLFDRKADDEEFRKSVNTTFNTLQPLLKKLKPLVEEYGEATAEIQRIEREINTTSNEIDSLKKLSRNLQDSFNYYVNESEKYSYGIKKLFHPSRESNYKTLADKNSSDLDKTRDQIEGKTKKLTALSNDRNNFNEKISSLDSNISVLKRDLLRYSLNWKSAHQIINSASDPYAFKSLPDELERLYQKTILDLRERELLYKETEQYTKEQILSSCNEEKANLETLEQRKKNLEEGNTSTDISSCKVFACTLDTCLSRIKPDDNYNISHVFLDEAGYCSLIKGATLTAFDCPVTMLGDHMQLPPVSEVNEDELKNSRYESLVLWVQSALYIPEAIQQPISKTRLDYSNNIKPTFSGLKKTSLLHTHRFGKTLASVLAGSVYDSGFTGSDEHDTDIYYIDAIRVEEGKLRFNQNESNMVVDYIRTHPNENIGVIAPYNKQVQMIKEDLRRYNIKNDNVLTVHKAQGREWDTILFSVTDTQGMYFTDSTSQKSNGKNIINTAVSRAKKKLVIICDYSFWIRQNRQLIGKLLSVAKQGNNRY